MKSLETAALARGKNTRESIPLRFGRKASADARVSSLTSVRSVPGGRAVTCEHMFLISQGHAYSRFVRAVLSRTVKPHRRGHARVRHVKLEDALRVPA